MTYSIEDARKAVKYLESGMTPSTISILMNKTRGTNYSEKDIVDMANELKNTPPPSGNGRLYDVAAGIVFNPKKRKKIKMILFSILVSFVSAMIMLGFFVSWKPVLITLCVIVGLIMLLAILFIAMSKSGFLERLLEK